MFVSEFKSGIHIFSFGDHKHVIYNSFISIKNVF